VTFPADSRAAYARRLVFDHNIGHAGRFSSDCTIAAYAADIWQAGPCPVEPGG